MRIIGFGDLYIDYYFKNDLLIGVMGGKTNANILCNLRKYYETAFIGVVGNDFQGKICIDSLNKIGVNTEHIKIIDYPTKQFFIMNNEYSTRCPYCSRESSYHGNKYTKEDVLEYIREDDYIIVDNANELTMDIMKSIPNKAFLDLSYIGELRYLSLDEILSMLASRFIIIKMNERVYNYLKEKFALDSQDLYKYLQCEILIINRGKRGTDIIYGDEFEKKEIEDPSISIDTNGTGEAFFSEFIHTYLESDIIDMKMIGKAYLKASGISSYVGTIIGARSHLIPLVKITNYEECICKYIEY